MRDGTDAGASVAAAEPRASRGVEGGPRRTLERLVHAAVAVAVAWGSVAGAGCLGGAHPEPPTARTGPEGGRGFDAGVLPAFDAHVGAEAGPDAASSPPGFGVGDSLAPDVEDWGRQGNVLRPMPWFPVPPPWLDVSPALPGDGGLLEGDAEGRDGAGSEEADGDR
jgi:hypothetical protein